jgi:hypothetical protein
MPSRTRTLILGLATMALLLGAVASADAETYTVTRTDDPNPAPCEATNCSLRGALTAANATTSVDDVVILPASAAPYLIQYEMLSLPISDEVEVRGAGADRTVVRGDGEEIVFTIDAKSTLSGLTITGGKGGIQNGSDLTLRAVSVEGNERADAGGGIQTNGPLTIESSFLGANKTSGISGGAIQANAEVRIVNSTIAGNSSMGASAINGNDSVLIADSAVVGNRSGGTSSAAVRGSPLTVSNSIFSDNRDAEGLRGCTSLPAFTSLGGNVSDEATCGAGPEDRPNVDPLLGTLALHGGSTLVYDLLAGSPAIDFAVGACPALDQRGTTRPQGPRCDSGPFEVEVPPTPPPPSDVKVWMRLEKGKLVLNRKGVVRVGLTCLAIEETPPCHGRVRLKVRPKVEFAGKAKRLLPLDSAAFSIPAGKTKRIALKLSPKKAELVRDELQARKVLVLVRARDGAGNSELIERRRKLRPVRKR